ncbi:MAG: leucine-rich repeat domain-containing protein, partial [Clostridia bacterium]|nr:leucine-rich repeat domain-containing protein [Clostridia bacterium]
MKKSVKKLTILCAAVALCIMALALIKFIVSGFGTVGLEFKSNGDGTCYVSGVGKAEDEDIVIPLISPYGDRVTAIGESAFEGYDKLKTIKLTGWIESIGADAFYGCDNLEYAKYDNALYIGNEYNPYLILYKAASVEIESVDIHHDTEIIYGSAFSGCSKLCDVVLPECVKSIGSYAFAWCDSLEEIHLSDSVRVIEEYAFLGCDSLLEITVPSGVERIDNWTFAFCDELENVKLLEDNLLELIGDYSFYGCESLLGFDIGGAQNLKSIGYAAFAGCSSMESVTLPGGVIYIDELAFLGCDLDNENEILAFSSRPADTEYVNDLPKSFGMLNVILKAKQLKNLNFYTEGVIPVQTGDIESHKMHAGLPYSSTRIDNLFVPNFVSLYSFITAAKNPHSYLYTVDIGELGNVNGDTYYGAVCSTYCSYALGIDGMYTTYQWTQVPDMHVLEDQSVSAIQIGDSIVGNGHVVMVTGITRDLCGNVCKVTIMDIAKFGVRERVFTRDKFLAEYPVDEFTICRYGKIDDSQYETIPFVLVCDKTPKTFNCNLDIIPRKGDRANWLVGDDVEIDVLNTEDYTSVEIYRGEKLIDVREISDLIVISGL